MEDSGSPKKSKTKISKFIRMVGLFEIPRPNKTKLLRTNSLPASRRSDTETKTSRGLLKSYSNGESKVQKLKEEIEQRCKKDFATLTPKPVKKKIRKQLKEDQLRKNWLVDKEKIMEDINKLQERIEVVTEEIQNSDTELEITIINNDDDVFEEILRGKLCDDDSESSDFNRLSSDTVLHRVSSDTIKEEDIDFESNISVNLMEYRRSLSAEAVYEISRESGEFSWAELENNEDTETKKAEEHNEEADTNRESKTITNDEVANEEIGTNEDPESLDETEYYAAAESNETYYDSYSQTSTNEDTEYLEAVESNEESESIDNDSSRTSANEDAQTEPDSIEWWHKSFVQINQETSLENEEKTQNAESSPFTGRFIKNNRSRRNKRTDKRRTGILQKPLSVKELTKRFEGFQAAADEGETENYRRSFIEEMDKEIENMLNDGFRDDFHLSFENLTLLGDDEAGNKTEIDLDNLPNNKSEDKESNALYQTIIVLPKQEEQQYEDSDQDFFGETYFREDLENGLYYLETYNADGKELIMCSVQVERQSVDLNSFDEMKANSSSSKFLTNDESMLVLMGGANESKSGTDSKRTTIYSTTSGESFEDEGIDIEQTSSNYGSNASARRETYCDEQGIVRIERVGPYPPEESHDYKTTINNYYYSGEEDEGARAVVEEENYYEFVAHQEEVVVEVKKETLQYILDEIKSTEKKYVSDIRKVLKEYKAFLEERCPEKVDVVFANLEQIYQGQLQFMEVLEASNEDIIEVAGAFIDFEDLFRLYPKYFKNTPKANVAVKDLSYLIKEKQDKINDKLHLSAYLLTPLQRLGKYKLFLENIIKQLDKEGKSRGAVQMALDVVKKYMSKGNDAVAIASILFSPLHTREYGAFISREKFALLKPKRMEVMVFLFEDVVVFTTEDLKSMEQFIYHQSIKTNDLRIATYDDTTIHLTDYTKTKRRNSSKYTYILDAKTEKSKMAWKQQIEKILWMQMKKIKENTLKEYQSGSNKHKHQSNKKLTKTREQRSKSTGSSVFYVE